MEIHLAPLAMPCKNVRHDGYPNLTQKERSQVPLKEIEWFINLVGQSIYVASASYNGVLHINDHAEAKEFFNSQGEGYRFIALIERAKYALGPIYYDQSLAFQEPKLNKLYRFDYYVNGVLKDSNTVQYNGLTDNKKFHLFKYVNGPNKAGHSCHLLKVDYFPTYQNASNPAAVIFEKYTEL
jgi:hypothetical protein